MHIKQIVEDTSTPAGRIFDATILMLILVSVASFSLETLPGLSSEQMQWLRWVEIITVAVFTIEYLLRVAVATSRANFIFSFYGLIDLIAILPFYVSFGLDFRSLRAFRLLRVIRVFKLTGYHTAVRRLHDAIMLAKEELLVYLGVSIMLVYLAAVGIYYFEHAVQPDKFLSIFHSLWWAIVTLTTVGYGDVVPITIGGRLFTFFILLIGLGIVAVPSGVLASALSEIRDREVETVRRERADDSENSAE
jgi:voltage-gated potassium channel